MCKKLQVYLLILDSRENNNSPNLFPSKILSANFLCKLHGTPQALNCLPPEPH